MKRRAHHDPEWQQARGSGLRRLDFAWLRGHGIPGGLTAWPCSATVDLILRDAVVFRRGQRFEFARFTQGEDVERVVAYTILARDSGGAPLDVVAWHPRTGRVATWLGRIGLLGLEYSCSATSNDPLTVFPDVGAWLAGQRRGVVVVDERLARPELLEAGAIQASDIAHGTALKAMLAKVRLPSILVPAVSVERAAA